MVVVHYVVSLAMIACSLSTRRIFVVATGTRTFDYPTIENTISKCAFSFVPRLSYSIGIRSRNRPFDCNRASSRLLWGEGSSDDSSYTNNANRENDSSKVMTPSTRLLNTKITKDEEGRKLRIRGDRKVDFRPDFEEDSHLKFRNEDNEEFKPSKPISTFKRNDELRNSDDDQKEPFSRFSNKIDRKVTSPGGKRPTGSWDDFEATTSAKSSSDFNSLKTNRRLSIPENSKERRGNWDDSDTDSGNESPIYQSQKGRSFHAPVGRRDRGDRREGNDTSRMRKRTNESGYGRRYSESEYNKQKRVPSAFTNYDEKDSREGKINLRALEAAGFVHLYGLAPTINALSADRRKLRESDDDVAPQEDDQGNYSSPEARFRPCLFIQDKIIDGRSADKASIARELEDLAKKRGVALAYVDKGILNSLCDNRPHQGYVLRCGKLEFDILNRIPIPSLTDGWPSLWLVLDEVVDPQNFGALLRSAFFLGGNDKTLNRVGILVCAKNSAPPSPVVSAASAGALEMSNVYSTSNLPRTLSAAKLDGWRIIGAAASVPSGLVDELSPESPACVDLCDLKTDHSRPTLLVLGSEGQGLRHLVAKQIQEFVRIPGGFTSFDHSPEEPVASGVGVDSLNVSACGAIMLWHLLYGR